MFTMYILQIWHSAMMVATWWKKAHKKFLHILCPLSPFWWELHHQKKTQIFIFSTNENTWVVFLQWPLCEAAASPWKAAQGDFLVFFVPLHHQADINRQSSWQPPPRWRREWWDERCTRSTTRTSPSMGFTSTSSRSAHVYFSWSLVTTRQRFRFPGIYFWKKFPSFQCNPFI